MRQLGSSSPSFGVKIKNIWNHHPVIYIPILWDMQDITSFHEAKWPDDVVILKPWCPTMAPFNYPNKPMTDPWEERYVYIYIYHKKSNPSCRLHGWYGLGFFSFWYPSGERITSPSWPLLRRFWWCDRSLEGRSLLYSWWLNPPIWNICAPNGIISSVFEVKIRHRFLDSNSSPLKIGRGPKRARESIPTIHFQV